MTGDLHPMSVLARGGPVVVPPPEVGGKIVGRLQTRPPHVQQSLACR